MNLTTGRRYELYWRRLSVLEGIPLYRTTGFRIRWLHCFWWHGEAHKIWVFWRYRRLYPRELKWWL